MDGRKVRLELPQRVLREFRAGTRLCGEDARDFLENRATADVQRRFDARISATRRMSAMLQLSYGVAEFLPKIGRTQKLPARPVPRAVGIPVRAYAYAARVALERAVLKDDFGAGELDTRGRDALVRMAADWTQCMLLSDILAASNEYPASDPRHAGSVEVIIGRDGAEIFYRPAQFDALVHSEARSRREPDEDPRDVEMLDRIGSWLATGQPDPPEFAAISDALASDAGYGVIDTFAALKVGAYFTLDAWVGHCDTAQWRDQLAHAGGQVINPLAAFEAMTLRAGTAALAAMKPHRLRHRPAGLLTHPFVVSGDRVYLIRDLLFDALNLHWHYLAAGEWPIPPAVRRHRLPRFHKALERRRNGRGRDSFEWLVQRTLDDADLPHTFLSCNSKYGSTRSTREVDAVVVDLARRTIWVLEAKDMFSDGTLIGFQQDIAEFYDPDEGYIKKLGDSVRDVGQDPGAVARHVVSVTRNRWKAANAAGAARPVLPKAAAAIAGDDPWVVRGAFVVRDGSPVEHVRGCPFPTVTARGLIGLIGAAEE